MPDQKYPTAPDKSKHKKLRILSGGGKPSRTPLRQLGVSPSETMASGPYKVICEAARIASKWGRPVVECAYRVVEGDHFGTALPGWIEIKLINNGVMPGCQYAKVCELILGRELEPDDDIEPDSILVGKVLLVEARFKLTDGKSRNRLDSTQRKDGDFLRVCSVLGVGSL
jgi:hypothetical protein